MTAHGPSDWYGHGSNKSPSASYPGVCHAKSANEGTVTASTSSLTKLMTHGACGQTRRGHQCEAQHKDKSAIARIDLEREQQKRKSAQRRAESSKGGRRGSVERLPALESGFRRIWVDLTHQGDTRKEAGLQEMNLRDVSNQLGGGVSTGGEKQTKEDEPSVVCGILDPPGKAWV